MPDDARLERSRLGRRGRVALGADLGADGIFLDNIWMGATPWSVRGHIGGFAGCACERCRHQFRHETGREIPSSLGRDPVSNAYLAWRAGIVTRRVAARSGHGPRHGRTATVTAP